ncbi:MAG TPA: hypothetical protein VMV10_14690 [Pirellulales bacterium]|nr:hypothetical protein [Pirellulales bacterium]
MRTRTRAGLALGVVGIVLVGNSARGDGGALQLSQPCGDCVVSVFTSPTTLRVGKIDVSVYVQDSKTSLPVRDAAIFVTAAPAGRDGRAVRHRATAEQAANKLFQAAEFELPEAGRWEFSIEATGLRSPVAVSFEAHVAEPPPQWLALAPWIGWPWLVVAAFVATRFSRRR